MPELTEVIYTPESELRHPGRLLRSMFQDLANSRELAWRLFVRDVSARYRQSFLGYLWAFLPPLFTALTFVFLRSQGVFKTGDTSIPYPAYVMIGLLLWQAFVDAVQSPLKAVTGAKSMLTRINFPREAVLLAGLAEVVFNFLIRLALMIVVFIWFKLTPPVTIWLVPLGVSGIVALGFMVGVVLTPLGVLYSDVGQGLPLITTFWMFLTPVIYPPPQAGLGALLSYWNPVAPLIVVTRDWLTLGVTAQWPAFVVVFSATLLLLFLGWMTYRIAMPHLIARIGS